MNALEKLQQANRTALAIIASFADTAAAAPDVVAVRKAELIGELVITSKKEDLFAKLDELVAKIVELEKPKVESGVKVEDIAKALLVSPDCACLTYDQLAGLIVGAFPDRNTSAKSLASYASKHGKEWNIAARDRVRLDMASIMAMGAAQAAAAPAAEPASDQAVVNG